MFVETNTMPMNSNTVAVNGTNLVQQQQNYLAQYTANPFWPHYEYANQWQHGYGVGSYTAYDSMQAFAQQQTDYTEGCPVITVASDDLPSDADVFASEEQVVLHHFGASSQLYNQYSNLSSLDQNS